MIPYLPLFAVFLYFLSLKLFIHLSGASEKALTLPEEVVNAMQVPSCDPKNVVSQFQKSVHLTSTALDNPENEDKRLIRCLADTAKSQNRKELVEYLRTIVPAGTTGEKGDVLIKLN